MRNLERLEGREVHQWVGVEMALSEGTDGGPVIWRHPTIPYLQFDRLDAVFDDGEACSILSRLDDGSDYFGVYSPTGTRECLSLEPYQPGSIFRTRMLAELPVGKVSDLKAKTDESGNVLELSIGIAGSTVRIVSGEIYETWSDAYKIELIDESLLVQVISR